MKINKVAKDNHAFYYVAIAQTMSLKDFTETIIDSLDTPSLHNVKGGGSGYVDIDCTKIKGQCSEAVLINALRDGMLSRVIMKIPDSITGDLNENVYITEGSFKFKFKIIKYERDGNHSFEVFTIAKHGPEHDCNPELIEELSSIPEDEELGRYVDLKITFVK